VRIGEDRSKYRHGVPTIIPSQTIILKNYNILSLLKIPPSIKAQINLYYFLSKTVYHTVKLLLSFGSGPIVRLKIQWKTATMHCLMISNKIDKTLQ
jgi:hypothetical protein